MKIKCKTGTTSKKIRIFIQDASVTTNIAGLTGLTNATAGLIWYYFRDGDTSATSVSIVSATLGTFTSGGFKEVDATHMPGVYELGIPNAVLSVAGTSQMFLMGATNMVPCKVEFELDAVDYQDATAFGLANLNATISSRMATFSLPANFSSLAITGGGAVTAGTVSDKTGYSLTQAFPANFSALLIDTSGNVVANITHSGTAQNGGATTIQLASGASTVDNIYAGQQVWVRSGTGAVQVRTIISYVGSTRTATVDRAWQSNPDNTSVYVLLANDAPKVDSSLGVTTGDKTGYTLAASQTFTLNGSITGDIGGKVLGGGASTMLGDGAIAASVTGNVGGNVNGNLGGNLVGNVNGNLVGNVNGDLKGRIIGNSSTPFVGGGVYAFDSSGAAIATASAISTLQTSVSNINNLSALANLTGPSVMEIPVSGSIAYIYTVLIKDVEGHLLDLSTSPTITAVNAAGTDRSANLSAVSHLATGQYTFTYTVASSAAQEGLYVKASGSASSDATTRVAFLNTATVSVDTASTLSAIKAKTDLIATNTGDSANTATAQGSVATLLGRLTSTRAGNLDNLDATISSLGTTGVKVASYASGQDPATYMTSQGYTTARATKLDNLDATMSSRLATTGYTAPDNAGITTIKNKTNQITFTYPNKVDAILPAGAGAGSGGGAWPVTILVNDGSVAISGAIVRVSAVGVSVFVSTGLDGKALFSLDNGTYTISVTVAGYSFTPIQDTVAGGNWTGSSTPTRTVSMSIMVSPIVPPSIKPGLSFNQLQTVFKNFGKLIYTARLAQKNAQTYRQHLLNLNSQFAGNADPTDGGLSYDVFFNYDMNMQEAGGGLVAQEDSGVSMAKASMDTYLMQIGSLVGAKPNDTPNTIASLLAGNVAAATGYVQPSGGVDPLSNFAAYFGQNYNVTLPQNVNAPFLDSWITTTIV